MNLNLDFERDIPVLEWESHLATRTSKMKGSAIRELLKLTQQPDLISFAGGLPAPELFPERAVEEACNYVIRNDGKNALQYSSTEGYKPLRKFLADQMHKYGIPVKQENVLLTNGSQQALDLLGKVLIDPGQYVLTGSPTYLGAIQAWNAYQANFHTINLDEEGMVVDEVERAYEKAIEDSGKPPAFIYVLPNFHNPAGTTLPWKRRQKLAEIATKLDLPVVEDDPYGKLRYEGQDVGLRLGWLVCPTSLMTRFVQAKQGCDLHTGTFAQYIINDICQRGLLKPHINNLRTVYKKRRDTMLDALAEFWPEGCSWTRPEGGLFLWARVPTSIDTLKFFNEWALKENVAYVPGVNFYPNKDGGHNAMRLNFSYAPEETIIEGISDD
ncbi:MAG: hypothetical protein B6I38_01220 [Anaerolineaceae bacterium 4572_5.1]|nr:MAG: hypothetical protein B6I38_01220 [Anaerolineaceae bacterium 4572_5.1]